MTKVLFLLSAIVMVVAIAFSYLNRQTFVQNREARVNTDKQIATEKNNANKAADEVAGLKSGIAAMNNEVSSENERLHQAEIKVKNAESEATRTNDEYKSTDAEIKKIKEQVGNLPPGVTVETINEDIAKRKATIAENAAKATKGEEETQAKQKELKRVQDELTDVQKRIEERKKLFERNRLTATIVAVNNDWGFVVIDGGANKSITTDTKLLVTRGNNTIGKLAIVQVEPNKTLANIVQKSVRPGMSIAPGDKVILESLYQ